MRRYVACFGQELHKTANRRRYAGTHYVDGMMLVVKTAEVWFGLYLTWKIVDKYKNVFLDRNRIISLFVETKKHNGRQNPRWLSETIR